MTNKTLIDGPVNLLVVKGSYNSMLKSGARLFVFANSNHGDLNSDISSLPTELAAEDMIAFAISSRRFLEGCSAVKAARRCNVSKWKIILSKNKCNFEKLNDFENIWSTINTIIHSKFIEIVRSPFEANMSFGRFIEGFDYMSAILQSPSFMKSRFSAKVMIGSDRNAPFIFDLAEFIEVFDGSLLDPLLLSLADKKVFLGSEYDE